MTTTLDSPETTGSRPNLFVRIYRGETSFDFVGRRRVWYGVSAAVIVAGLISLFAQGFNLGIDFKGGTAWTVTANGTSAATATKAVKAAGVNPSLVQGIGVGSSATIEVQADLSKLSASALAATEKKVADALATATHATAKQKTDAEQNVTNVGPTWGGVITKKAIIAVIVFFILVVGYITFRFEWKMAIAALVAVIHDLLVVAGIYSLSGLQVTPDTVIAVLTILGYSLYDTVVVFDRVADNTKNFGASTGKMTYEDVVNLSMNQTLARSINTSLVAILPVLSVLVIGAQILGASTLQYFGLALVIGLFSGAYSSIFIASPLLAQMKEREPRYRTIRQKLANRADGAGLITPKAAALMTAAAATPGSGRAAAGRSGTARGAAAKRQGPARSGQVLRPGVRPASKPAPAPVEDDGDVEEWDELDDDGVDGAETTARAAKASPGPARPRPQGSGPRRPPPRKKGGKKGGRRR